MLYREHLVPIVQWLAVCVLCIDITLVVYIFHRRLSRNRYYRTKDAVLKRFSKKIQDFLTLQVGVDSFVEAVKPLRGRAARDAIQDALLGGINSTNRDPLTQALLRLRYLERWSKQAFGRRRARELLRHILEGAELPGRRKRWRRKLAPVFRLRLLSIRRALAVSFLGQLDSHFAQVFMREALDDPSPYVGRANVAAMGRNRQTGAVTALLELLRAAVRGENELPVRSIKTALVRYSMQDLPQFTPFVSDPQPRFRFLVVDSIREICSNAQKSPGEGTQFPLSLYRWFLQQGARDKSQDVRARSAAVIGFFRDANATQALRVLMRDENEFVRLHAVRACRDPYYSELIADVVERITDPRWRVREAAVVTLAAFKAQGRRQLARSFLATTDRYASEQIAEEMQRSGAVIEMLSALRNGDAEARSVLEVCAKMVRLEKGSLLTEHLRAESNPITGDLLLDALLTRPTRELLDCLRAVAENPDHPVQDKAQALLRSNLGRLAAAAGKGG